MEQRGTDFFELISPLIKAKPMRQSADDWDYVLKHAEHVPVAYTRSMVAYQSAYAAERADSFADLSMILHHENKPVCVWPLNMRFSENAWVCGSNEGPVLAPLFAQKIPEKTRKALIGSCLNVLESLNKMTNPKKWKGMDSVWINGVDQWHRKIMEKGATIQRVSHDLYVDLSLSLDQIRSNLRKSYRPLLSMGDKLWQTSVLEKVDHDTFNEFRQLHYQVAGRATRSIETWDLQEKAVNSGEAFLVILRDESGVLVGGGLFHISKTEGLYAVGVYDRNLFDKPLGHIVQMKAIEHMKTLGLRWHKLGERFYPGDSTKPSEKELSISHFKEGFATHMFLRLHVSVTV